MARIEMLDDDNRRRKAGRQALKNVADGRDAARGRCQGNHVELGAWEAPGRFRRLDILRLLRPCHVLDQLLPLPRSMLPLKTRQCVTPGRRSIGVLPRLNAPSQPMTELYLIQGEVPDTRDLDDARQWVTIYRELVTFADRTLSRLRREKSGNMEADGANASDADERGMEGHLRRLQSRLDFLGRRAWGGGRPRLHVCGRVVQQPRPPLTPAPPPAPIIALLPP